MKFLCDQCKAKYQIADDKVAGKTVRMKCRKCGHMIEVRASVTETSVAGANAGASAAAGQSEPPTMGGPPKPPPAKPSSLPARSPLATSLSQAKPPPPRPTTNRPDAGLATAFKSSMQTAKEDEAALLELSSADEWYAAINGVPVGPIRIGELRRKASLGAVTDDSLVWQEGMEEWRPVKTIAELATLVREAASNRGPSLGTPDPPNVRQSGIPPAPGIPSMRPAPARPMPPRPASERPVPTPLAARSNVVPITSRLATAERLEEAPAASPQTPTPPGGPQSERFSIAPDPFNAPAAAATAASHRESSLPAPSSQQQSFQPQPQKGPPNYMGIGVIAAFMMFGGVAAYAVFFKPPAVAPPPQVIVQQVPMPQQTAAAAAGPAPTDTAPVASASNGKVASHGGPATAGGKDAGAGAAAPDLHGLLGGLGSGPNVGPASGASLSGAPLTEGQLTSVVTSHAVAVRRQCVDKGASTASSSNEVVQVTINGSGQVTNTSATGNDSITGHCLEMEIRHWSFPATGATTTVNLPFHFVRQ